MFISTTFVVYEKKKERKEKSVEKVKVRLKDFEMKNPLRQKNAAIENFMTELTAALLNTIVDSRNCRG